MSDKKLKKMSQAHTVYRLEDGTRVPSATTVLELLNKPALVKWAYNLGVEGVDMEEYRRLTARIGTLAHYLIQCDLANERPDMSEYSWEEQDHAENAILKWYEYRKVHDLKPYMLEQPLVSEVFRYGGTLDFYGVRDGELAIIDFKTGGAIYDEAKYQVAAYRELAIENHLEPTRGFILRVGRDEQEGFEEKEILEWPALWKVFWSCLLTYRAIQDARKASRDAAKARIKGG